MVKNKKKEPQKSDSLDVLANPIQIHIHIGSIIDQVRIVTPCECEEESHWSPLLEKLTEHCRERVLEMIEQLMQDLLQDLQEMARKENHS